MSKVHVKTGDTVILLTGKDEYLYNDKDNKSARRKAKLSLKASTS